MQGKGPRGETPPRARYGLDGRAREKHIAHFRSIKRKPESGFFRRNPFKGQNSGWGKAEVPRFLERLVFKNDRIKGFGSRNSGIVSANPKYYQIPGLGGC